MLSSLRDYRKAQLQNLRFVLVCVGKPEHRRMELIFASLWLIIAWSFFGCK
jgi:hypothetical protein